MKLVLFMCVLGSAFAALTFPSNSTKFDNVLDVSSALNGDVATFWVRKNRKGFLGFGFGANMNNGDIFLVQVANNTLTFSNCKLVGEVAPTCSATGLWALVDSSFNTTDGTWAVQVQRNIKQLNGVTINTGENTMIYDYSDSLTLDNGHSTNATNAAVGTKVWNLTGNLLKFARIVGVASAAILAFVL